ncbi:hypothetical protein [Actibacterium sp. D379-3]
MTKPNYLIAIVALALQPLITSVSSAQTLDGSEQGLPSNILGDIRIALSEIGARDPISAQFHSLAFNHEGDGASHVCGYVNLKNGYGAYVGFQAFQMSLDNQSLDLLEATPAEPTWNLARLIFDMSGCSVALDLPPRN